MSTTVRAFKLKSGEEIMGRCISAEDPIILEKVRMYIIAGADPTGQLQINALPFSVIAQDGEIELREDGIVSEILTIPEEIEKAYLNSTSAIQLVSA